MKAKTKKSSFLINENILKRFFSSIIIPDLVTKTAKNVETSTIDSSEVITINDSINNRFDVLFVYGHKDYNTPNGIERHYLTEYVGYPNDITYQPESNFNGGGEAIIAEYKKFLKKTTHPIGSSKFIKALVARLRKGSAGRGSQKHSQNIFNSSPKLFKRNREIAEQFFINLTTKGFYNNKNGIHRYFFLYLSH